MSIVRKDEFTAHLGVSKTPTRAQASLDAAETVVGAYLSIDYNRRGSALQEHTVSERITPIRDKRILEVHGGPVTGIESIAYNVTGFRHTGDEVADDFSTETATFDYVFNPNYAGWSVSGRNSDGSAFTFQRGQEYRITYRTGWSAGNVAQTWEWFRTSASDTWEDADRLGWGFTSGAATATNSDGGYLLGPQPVENKEGIHYETGGVAIDRLTSPSFSVIGGDFPFIVARVNLIRASTSGFPYFEVAWKDGDGREFFTGKKTERGDENFLPDRMRASALIGGHTGYATLVADMGFNPASDMNEQTQSPVRNWIDNTISQIGISLWRRGDVDPDGALFLIDYIQICDGLARMPAAVKLAVLETAKAIRDGLGSGVQSEGIGDYSKASAAGEAARSVPPIARTLLSPWRRPSW
jgi:hypothetical protein